MTFEPHDVYLALSVIAGCVFVYACSRALYYDQAERRHLDLVVRSSSTKVH